MYVHTYTYTSIRAACTSALSWTSPDTALNYAATSERSQLRSSLYICRSLSTVALLVPSSLVPGFQPFSLDSGETQEDPGDRAQLYHRTRNLARPLCLAMVSENRFMWVSSFPFKCREPVRAFFPRLSRNRRNVCGRTKRSITFFHDESGSSSPFSESGDSVNNKWNEKRIVMPINYTIVF